MRHTAHVARHVTHGARFVDREVREAGHEFLERHAHFQARQMGADAAMDAEAEVDRRRIALARDVETVGI